MEASSKWGRLGGWGRGTRASVVPGLVRMSAVWAPSAAIFSAISLRASGTSDAELDRPSVYCSSVNLPPPPPPDIPPGRRALAHHQSSDGQGPNVSKPWVALILIYLFIYFSDSLWVLFRRARLECERGGRLNVFLCLCSIPCGIPQMFFVGYGSPRGESHNVFLCLWDMFPPAIRVDHSTA